VAVTFDTSRLSFTFVSDTAKPDIFIASTAGNIICHMTEGFDSAKFPIEQRDAFTANAQVPVRLTGGDTIDGWDYGFVQFARANACRVFYVGPTRANGRVTVQVHIPPALASAVHLDQTSSASVPWFSTPMLAYLPPMISARWGDHPAVRIPATLRNSTTNSQNYLFHYQDEREFWSIFTARDPSGKLDYIGHFQWKVRWDCQFYWMGGKLFKRNNTSSFDIVQRKVIGPPTDPDVKPLLADPKGPAMKEEFGGALTRALYGARGPNRSEDVGWYTNVPQDFYTA